MPFNIYDQECPVCKTPKRLKVGIYSTQTELKELLATRTEYWGYGPSGNERIIEAFCPDCGVKFVAPE